MKGNFCHSSKFDSLSDMILKCSLVLPFLSIFAFANPFVRYAGHLIDAKHQFSNRRLLNNRASEDLNDDLSFVGSLPGDLFAVGNSRANHPGLSNIDYPESSPFDSQDTPIIPKLKDNSVDATNVALDQIDPQVSLTLTNSELVAECSPNNGYNRKRSISLDNQRACPNNAIPGRKPGPNIRNQPSDDQNQTPKSSSQTREPNDDPCGDRPSPAGGIPPMTELVSCGGPIVDTRLHPAYVFNCVPGNRFLFIDDRMKLITPNRSRRKYRKTDIFRHGSAHRQVLLFLPSRLRTCNSFPLWFGNSSWYDLTFFLPVQNLAILLYGLLVWGFGGTWSSWIHQNNLDAEILLQGVF